MEKATLLAPLQELLARYRVTPYQLKEKTDISNMKNGLNLLELKLERLSCDPRFRKQLLPVRKTLSLNEGTLDCRINEEEIIFPVALTEPGLEHIPY